FNEVRFQDIADFSRTTFGQYKGENEYNQYKIVQYPSPQVLFKNNTFEKEADLLQVNFKASALLINNRFRTTLDLTGVTFTTSDASLCFSFNRISRIKLELEHLGSSLSVSPFELLIDKPLRSLFTDPLSTSRVRQVVEPESKPKCDFIYKTKGNI